MTKKNIDVAVVIPAFNEVKQIRKSLAEVLKEFSNVILIDDGSTDDTFDAIHDLNIHKIKHPINLGQGAALQTGITFAIRNLDVKYILTFDADGQHSLNSAVKMLDSMRKNPVNIVLGSRFLDVESIIPSKKKLILKLGVIFTRFDTGLKVTDTHNGLRIMDLDFARKIQIKQPGMAHASEILSLINSNAATWREFPAEIYYSEYAVKKGQSILNAINILTEMIHK
jgi:glycosyltransferase involved in cell wall biosynthesis